MQFEFQQPVFTEMTHSGLNSLLQKNLPKFTMIFHDSTKKKKNSKDQNKGEFKNLDTFEVLSSDFEALETSAASLTSPASAASLASATSTALFTQRTSCS